MVAPDRKAHEADEDARQDHDRVAEQRLAAEGGDDLGDDPEGGQNDDVDLRVSEDPEQMLPQDRQGTRRGNVEEGPERAIHDHLEQRDGERRKGEHDQE